MQYACRKSYTKATLRVGRALIFSLVATIFILLKRFHAKQIQNSTGSSSEDHYDLP